MSTTLHLRVNRFSHDAMSPFHFFFFFSFLNTSQSDPYQFVYADDDDHIRMYIVFENYAFFLQSQCINGSIKNTSIYAV